MTHPINATLLPEPQSASSSAARLPARVATRYRLHNTALCLDGTNGRVGILAP